MAEISRRHALAALGGTSALFFTKISIAADEMARHLKDTLATEIRTDSSIRLFFPNRLALIDGWDSYTCSAHGWNKIPKPWKDMEIFASNIDWWGREQDPTLHFTSLGGPFDVSSLRIGDGTGHMVFITSEDDKKPMRVFGEYFNQWDHLWSLTNDSYTDDNTGGWILHTRKTR